MVVGKDFHELKEKYVLNKCGEIMKTEKNQSRIHKIPWSYYFLEDGEGLYKKTAYHKGIPRFCIIWFIV